MTSAQDPPAPISMNLLFANSHFLPFSLLGFASYVIPRLFVSFSASSPFIIPLSTMLSRKLLPRQRSRIVVSRPGKGQATPTRVNCSCALCMFKESDKISEHDTRTSSDLG